MDNQLIFRVQKHDYLGVTMSANLSWKNQCNKVCNKAKRTLGLVKRTLHAGDISVRKIAYEMLIRPSMEYATCAWSPHTQKDAQCLETVQRAAARFVCDNYKKTSSVIQMMNTLNWDTLATRWLCRNATMVYKLVHQKVGIPLPDFIVRGDLRTRGSTHKFTIIRTKCVLYQKSTPGAYPCGTCCQYQLWRPPLLRTFRRWPRVVAHPLICRM